MRDDPQNTPNDPAVKLTAELLGVPVDRIPRALEESDFLGQVFLTRREMQNPKAPRYMRTYQPTEADAIETSKPKIGRASCRERVCLYVYVSGVDVSLTKKNN